MNREFEVKGVEFLIGNYTPRHNEFEKGLKYQLFVKRNLPRKGDYWLPTEIRSETLKELKAYATENYWVWK